MLLTDGLQTAGDLQKAAVGAGVPISVVPLRPLAGPEVCLSELRAPPAARPNDDFEADAVIDSSAAAAGTLLLLLDERPIAERRIELAAGRNVVPLRPVMPASGRARLVAQLAGFADTSPENNRRSAIVYALERPIVLILAADRRAGEHFAAALGDEGFEARVAGLTDWAATPPPLDQTSVLVLLDVPLQELTADTQHALARFVRKGGGVLAIGGSADV